MSHLGRPKSKVMIKLFASCGGKSDWNIRKTCEICKWLHWRWGEKSGKRFEIKFIVGKSSFYPEEAGDFEFARKLSAWGDIYVNDAFGTAHRACFHYYCSSILPKQSLFRKIDGERTGQHCRVLKTPEKPVVAILGGSKVSSKTKIIENILDKVDHLIIGGGMTYTFIKAKGSKVGDSICENDKLDLALQILDKAEQKGVSPFTNGYSGSR